MREEKEQKKKKLEDLTEKFEKQREYAKIEKKFDIFELKHRIETGRNLLLLQKEISEALKEGVISRESFQEFQEKIEKFSEITEKKEFIPEEIFSSEKLPFGKTEVAKFFETKKI